MASKREKAIVDRLKEINLLDKEGKVNEGVIEERRQLHSELERIKEKGRDRRVKAEIKRLTGLFEDIDENKKSCIDGLIKRASFMRVTLEDYEEDIRISGSTEKFTQSPLTPPYERERPVIRLYNTMNKNYQSIMKQLADALPEPLKSGREADDFDDFCRRD